MIHKKLNEKLYIKALIIISIFILNNCNVNKRKKMLDCCCYYLCCKCCKCCKKKNLDKEENQKNEIQNLSIKTSEIILNSKSSNNSKTINTNNTLSTYNSTPSSLNYPEIHNKQNSIIIIKSNKKLTSIQKASTPIPIKNKDLKNSSIAIIHEYDYKPRSVYNPNNKDQDNSDKNSSEIQKNKENDNKSKYRKFMNE